MRVSRILLLVVALLAGGLAAFLATRGGSPTPQQPKQVIEEARAQILVATAPIGIGQRLSPDNIAWLDWPEGAVRPDYISKEALPEALTDMQGTVARFEFFEGEPIRQQKLVKTDQGYLSAVLDKGKRGVSISVAADSASGGFIVPNDHVDLILTRNTADGDQSEVLLANVRVLAINTRLGEVGKTGGAANPEDPRAEIFNDTAIATLELTPDQAETVINARSVGRLSLALRSIVDFAEDTPEARTRSNAPIQIIRYGVTYNVLAGTTTGASVAPAADYQPAPSSTQSEPEL